MVKNLVRTGLSVRAPARAGLLALIFTALVSIGSDSASAAGANSITTPDFFGDVGEFPSMVLDASGFPVVSYLDNTNSLIILHCNDANCAGTDESITYPAPSSLAVFGTSIALDASGDPVVSYWDYGSGLRVLHCDDPNCDGTGDSNELAAPGELAGGESSLVLDSLGRPVVSFFDGDNVELAVLHCNDADCSGGDESLTYPDPGPNDGGSASLALDAAGRPVVSYCVFEPPGGCVSLKVLHCNDANCAGGNESIQTLGSNVGFTSLVLDGSGNPIVSHTGALLHCNDPNCAGGNESTSPAPDAGSNSSLELDALGLPVLSSPGSGLQMLHCNDSNCAGGDESLVTLDGDGFFQFAALVLDAAGNPVVAYHDVTNGDLKILHCADVNCDPDSDGDGCRDSKELQTDATAGGLRDPKNFWDFFDTPNASNVRDHAVAGTDFFRLLGRFGSSGDSGIDPLSPPPASITAYHTAFDRGPSIGPNPWNLTAANGAIAGTDFFALLAQFNHSCG